MKKKANKTIATILIMAMILSVWMGCAARTGSRKEDDIMLLAASEQDDEGEEEGTIDPEELEEEAEYYKGRFESQTGWDVDAGMESVQLYDMIREMRLLFWLILTWNPEEIDDAKREEYENALQKYYEDNEMGDENIDPEKRDAFYSALAGDESLRNGYALFMDDFYAYYFGFDIETLQAFNMYELSILMQAVFFYASHL